MKAIEMIHHISAIVGDPQATVDFYQQVLGLHLIKQTVNFDDPHTYHLYFSNQSVENGTTITFFPWKHAHEGRVGAGQVGRIAFRIPKGSSTYWKSRLASYEIDAVETNLFLQPTLEFTDSHALALALVEGDKEAVDDAIIGFHGAVLLSADPESTANTLKNHLGLVTQGQTNKNAYFLTTGDWKHHVVLPKIAQPTGRWGVGTVHHIAWSAKTIEEQAIWRTRLTSLDYSVTDSLDRKYFKAIYFKEPGQILFEIATEKPGFTVDEPLEKLGEKLMLPDWFENKREEITSSLPKLKIEQGDGNDENR